MKKKDIFTIIVSVFIFIVALAFAYRYFVLSPKVLDLIEGDKTTWEQRPMETLARDGDLSVFRHQGFWQPMDTIRDKTHLEELWASGDAPWKVWE